MQRIDKRFVAGGITRLLALTMFNVILQVASAVLIKTATLPRHVSALSLGIVAVVLALNAGRFLLWNRIHRYYDLSVAYPASALFFPFIVAASYLFGEHIDGWRLSGAAFVTIGVAILMLDARSKANAPKRMGSQTDP